MPYKFAVICASNQNRSMEAHGILSKKGFNVDSYGTNSMIKVPGPSFDRPNAYPFGTTYEHIYNDLKAKDASLYTQNGLLMLLDRNRKIKQRPQRFQDSVGDYDIIITCEERCFDLVVDELAHRPILLNKPVHIVNFDIKDTPEDATVGAKAILQLAQQLQECANLDAQIGPILSEYIATKASHPILYTVQFY